MKNVWILSLALLLMAGCKREKKEVIWDDVYLAKDMAGVNIEMSYPFMFGGEAEVADKINATIESHLIEDMPVECAGCSIDSATNRIIREKLADTLLMRIPYDLRSSGSVYTKSYITSVKLETEYFTGGANVNHRVVYLNFDHRTGELLRPLDFIIDEQALTEVVRNKFTKATGFKADQPVDETDLFIRVNELPLPENIGFEQNGLVFFYNLYEIAPRSYGTTKITVPYPEITTLLKAGVLY